MLPIPKILEMLSGVTQMHCDNLKIDLSPEDLKKFTQENEPNVSKNLRAISATGLKAILEKCETENKFHHLQEIEDLKKCRDYYQTLISDLKPENKATFELKESTLLTPEPLLLPVKNDVQNIINACKSKQVKQNEEIEKNQKILHKKLMTPRLWLAYSCIGIGICSAVVAFALTPLVLSAFVYMPLALIAAILLATGTTIQSEVMRSCEEKLPKMEEQLNILRADEKILLRILDDTANKQERNLLVPTITNEDLRAQAAKALSGSGA